MYIIQKKIGNFYYYAKFITVGRLIFSSWEELKDNATHFVQYVDGLDCTKRIPDTLTTEVEVIKFSKQAD